MVILRTRNKITDFLMILAWASPFNIHLIVITKSEMNMKHRIRMYLNISQSEQLNDYGNVVIISLRKP